MHGSVRCEWGPCGVSGCMCYMEGLPIVLLLCAHAPVLCGVGGIPVDAAWVASCRRPPCAQVPFARCACTHYVLLLLLLLLLQGPGLGGGQRGPHQLLHRRQVPRGGLAPSRRGTWAQAAAERRCVRPWVGPGSRLALLRARLHYTSWYYWRRRRTVY